VTQPDPKAPDVKALAATVASLSDRLADTRGQLGILKRRLHAAGIKDGTPNLVAQFEALAKQVADALDAAAPRGPAALRWDNLDRTARARQLAALKEWVDKILIPGWVRGGSYELAPCWPAHEQALWELGAIAVRWRQAYDRNRPDLALALEWQDRWLPGAMRHIAEATRDCKMGHQARLGLSCLHAADRAQRENPGRGGPDPRGPGR
jgi:hypothetical protein